MERQTLLRLLVVVLLVGGGVQCDRGKPTAPEAQGTGGIVIEVVFENPAPPRRSVAKTPVTKGQLRISGPNMDPREVPLVRAADGHMRTTLANIPTGIITVELYLLSTQDDTLWQAIERGVNIEANKQTPVVLQAQRVKDTIPKVNFEVTPQRDRINKPINFRALVSDVHDLDDSLEVRWDFEGDGQYNTPWSNNKEATYSYPSVGEYLVVGQVRDRSSIPNINTNVNDLSLPTKKVRVIDLIAQAGLKGLDRDTAVVAIPGAGRVDLDGKASQGLPVSLSDSLLYHWKHLQNYPGAKKVSIENTFNANKSRDAGEIRFAPSEEGAGLYAFSLTVEYAGVFSDPDTLLMQVRSRPPTAKAVAPDTVRLGEEVRLLGIGTDPDDPSGTSLAYHWRGAQVGLLSDSTSSAPTFVPDQEGVYVFDLVVRDADPQDSPLDRVQVQVMPANRRPVARAGPDASGFTGVDLSLDGSASSDPDPGDQSKLVYQWTSLDGPTLNDASSIQPSFRATDPRDYRFFLVVGDGELDSPPDTVVVAVSQKNRPPVAHAGEDAVAQIGEVVRLDGGASSDPDGTLSLEYRWTALGGGTLAQGTLEEAEFSAQVPGDYRIALTVGDGVLESAPDTVLVHLKDLPRLVFAAIEGGDYEIFSSRLDGSDRVNLSQQPGDDDQRPRVSPDGATIAFVSNRNHSADPSIEGAEAPDIWGMDRDGGNQRQLIADPAAWPALAADHSLAFSRVYGLFASDIFVQAAGEALPELLSDQSGQNIQPCWSPDSRRLVFAKADNSGFFDLYMVNRDGTGLEQLTNTPEASETEPAWSPDGARIALVSDIEDNPNVVIIELAGREQRTLTADAGAYHLSPSWSPDGAQIAYVRQDVGTAVSDIYIMNADGSNPQPVVENAVDPAWLPGQ